MPEFICFSLRYGRALKLGKLYIDLPSGIRSRLWAALKEYNEFFRVARRPNDDWTDDSDTISETILDMRRQRGVDMLSDCTDQLVFPETCLDEAVWLFNSAPPEMVFDAIEIAWQLLGAESQKAFNSRVNVYFDMEDCQWRLLHGEILQLDRNFLGAQVAEMTMNGLAAGPFAGAADEFAVSLRAVKAGDTKHAITEACKSYESMLKIVVGCTTAAADRLTSELISQGHLDDIPQHLQAAVKQSVLMSLPVLRNKLTAHGQGAEVVGVPACYAILATQLACALNNFLLAKYAEKHHTCIVDVEEDNDIMF